LHTPSNPSGIFFLHIPKAGGTTLLNIIERQYKMSEILVMYDVHYSWPIKTVKQFKSLTHKQQNKIKMIAGHFGYGLHNEINIGQNYITMLREPIERVVSNFKHMRREPTSEFSKGLSNKSLLEFVKDQNWHDLDNGQVRRLCGIENEENVIDVGHCTEEMLEQAKTNLKSCKSFGIMEMFDESLLLLSKELKWKNINYKIKNSAPKSKEHIDAEAFELIKDLNKYDIALYKYAKDLFNNRWLTSGISKLEVESYQNSNKNLSPIKQLKNDLLVSCRSKIRAIKKRL